MLNTRQIIALSAIKNCGAVTIRQIVDKSTLLNNSLCSDLEFMDFVNNCFAKGLKNTRLKKIDKVSIASSLSKADELLYKSEQLGIKAISYVEPYFPDNILSTINEDGKLNVPLVLYYKGNLSITRQKAIGIIGTRRPTNEGIFAGEYLGEKLSELGFNIVSGLAIGCDAAVHHGTLRSKGGKTTAILANGLDEIYPKRNQKLAEEIIENGGLLMSENPIGTKANNLTLISRDRIQAALSDAMIVIQTGVKGGTNHAANTTLYAQKPLFVVKFSNSIMNNENVIGNYNFVSKGAKLVTCSDFMNLINEKLDLKF